MSCAAFANAASRALVSALAVAIAACSSTPFREHGPTTLQGAPSPSRKTALSELRAAARPTLEVTPANALAGEPVRVQVDTATWDGVAWTVTMTPLGGTGALTLRYRLGGPFALPLTVGRHARLQTTAVGAHGQGLLEWADVDPPSLLAVVSVDGGAPSDAVAGLSVEPAFSAGALAYTEVRALADGCLVALDHFDLRAKSPGALVAVPPGAIRRVDLTTEAPPGGLWDLVSLDASRSSPRLGASANAIRCPTGAHVSWVLRLVPPAPSVP